MAVFNYSADNPPIPEMDTFDGGSIVDPEYILTDKGNMTNQSEPCRNDYCVSDQEYIDMIMDYIMPKPFEWAMISLYILVFMAGLGGNFLVCFAVWRNQHMRTVTNYFIVNLAVADFLVILICLPPTVLVDTTETWYMGSVMCKIVHYMQVSHFRFHSINFLSMFFTSK